MVGIVLDLQSPVVDIKFDKGKTVDLEIFYYDDNGGVVDLSNFSAKLQAKPSFYAANPLYGFDLSTFTSGITLVQKADPTTGLTAWAVSVSIPASVTKDIQWTTAVYELEVIDPSGKVKGVCKGTLTAIPGVIR